MTVSTRVWKLVLALAMALAVPGAARAQIINPGIIVGFNPQPDPPGFGPLTLAANQVIRVNITCFDHQIGLLPPDPCRGVVMIHDATGRSLREGAYDLAPGRSGFLQLANVAATGDTTALPLDVQPCIVPGAGGVAIPSVVVLDLTGRLVQFVNPTTPRMSQFNNSLSDPGSIVGFNPQPDPPGFGLVPVRSSQVMRVRVGCFAHPIDGIPPDPCRGAIMFHDALGNVVGRGTYALQPGEVGGLTFQPPGSTNALGLAINPCILPQPGGRAVPAVQIVDGETGDVLFQIAPAVPRMSAFQRR